MVLAFALPVQAGTPSVVLDGTPMNFEVPPVVEDGRTLVPMRAIFEAQGATVEWEEATQTVTAQKGDVTVKLTIGGKAFVNDEEVALEVAAKLVDGRTLVPLRFVSESLGAKVDWTEETETVTITSPAEEPATEEPATEEPATEEPAAEEPATEEPAAPVAETPFEEYLNTLPLNASVLAGVDKTAQFVVTGDQEETYALVIKDGTVTWTKGAATSPAITITTSEQVWLDVSQRKISPTDALMSGKFTAKGDIPFFTNIIDAFVIKK
jgi:putative sterol carrier protein